MKCDKIKVLLKVTLVMGGDTTLDSDPDDPRICCEASHRQQQRMANKYNEKAVHVQDHVMRIVLRERMLLACYTC